MATRDSYVQILRVDRRNCELLDPRDPARSPWRIRFQMRRPAPSNAWRSELDAELARRALGRTLKYGYLISPDHGISRYRYRHARTLGRIWRFLRRLRVPPLFIDADVPPGTVHVQLAYRELLDIIRAVDENVRRNHADQARSHIARRAALESMGKAVAAVDRGHPIPAETGELLVDLDGHPVPPRPLEGRATS